jgi:hypothetical protein
MRQKSAKTPSFPAQRAGKYTGAAKGVQLREMLDKQGLFDVFGPVSTSGGPCLIFNC